MEYAFSELSLMVQNSYIDLKDFVRPKWLFLEKKVMVKVKRSLTMVSCRLKIIISRI